MTNLHHNDDSISDILKASHADSIDDAAKIIQDHFGVNLGDAASHIYSEITDDEWNPMPIARRVHFVINHWNAELAYLQ